MPSVFDPVLCTNKEKNKLIQKPSSMYRKEPRSIYCPVTSCILWCMSVDGAGYPQMKLGAEFNDRFGSTPQNPGKILYSIYNNIKLDIPNFEISHLCHTKLCINTKHLNYEPKSINSRRNICFDQKKCKKNHIDEITGLKFPDCIHFLNCKS